jgi:hypothetical protein
LDEILERLLRLGIMEYSVDVKLLGDMRSYRGFIITIEKFDIDLPTVLPLPAQGWWRDREITSLDSSKRILSFEIIDRKTER